MTGLKEAWAAFSAWFIPPEEGHPANIRNLQSSFYAGGLAVLLELKDHIKSKKAVTKAASLMREIDQLALEHEADKAGGAYRA